MTLQQLKYALAVAQKKNISEAARSVFVSQPSLSVAVKELEAEIGVTIFARSNRGIMVTPQGEEFLGYARQVVEQAALLEAKYLCGAPPKPHFSVSSQHYSFAVNAFVDVIKQFGGAETKSEETDSAALAPAAPESALKPSDPTATDSAAPVAAPQVATTTLNGARAADTAPTAQIFHEPQSAAHAPTPHEYEFTLRETRTHEIIEDVRTGKSELGILYLTDFNQKVIMHLLDANELSFSELFTAEPHVFLSTKNPLAQKERITLADLAPYPFLSFEQGEYNSFYFSEEILSTHRYEKSIKVSDRATLFNLLIGLDGYTFSTGIISAELNGPNIIARALDCAEQIRVGTIMRKNTAPSVVAKAYLAALQTHIAPYGPR